MPRRHEGKGQKGVLRLALVYMALLASLTLVVWRQSRALDELRELDALRRDRAVLEAGRTELVRKLERLESRGHIVDFARRELGMHIPGADEIVLLRWPGDAGAAEANALTRRLSRSPGAESEASAEEVAG